MTNNTIKCSYISCKKESLGYFISPSSGLYLCKDHKRGVLKDSIEKIKSNPKYLWMFDMQVNK